MLQYIYLTKNVLHGCWKPVFITLRQFTNLTIPVIAFPSHKELYSGKASAHYDVNVNKYDYQ